MKALHGAEGEGHHHGHDAPPGPNAAVHVEGGLNRTEDGDLEHPEMKIRSVLEHFSVYALDAVEGHIGEYWEGGFSVVRSV